MKFNGQVVTAQVTDHNGKEVFAQYEGVTLAIDRLELPTLPEIGSQLKGLAYENKHGQARLTTKLPKVGRDHYAFAPVVEVRRDLGVFVDIGLPDKDIVVSEDQLPELSRLWPQRGDRLMIALTIDKKDRLWGNLADETIIRAVANRAKPDQMNADVTATAYRLKMAGTRVLTDDFYLGFIHPSERDVEPRLGQVLHARVIGVSDQGELNLSLKPRAYQAIGDDAAMILAVLQHDPAGKIAYPDKSDPAVIKQVFGISKGAFKRALGHLLKAGLIKEEAGYTVLLDSNSQPSQEA